MPEEPVDLKLILKELRELKALVQRDLELDERDLDVDKHDLELDHSEVAMEQQIAREELVIEQAEKRIEERTKLVAADLTGMHYVSLDAWKRMIWDACDSKRPKVLEKEIAYECALFGGPCKFELCPKNITRKQ